MAEQEITFHNNAEIKVQAQVYTGRTLVSTCLAAPGEIRTMPVGQHGTTFSLKTALPAG